MVMLIGLGGTAPRASKASRAEWEGTGALPRVGRSDAGRETKVFMHTGGGVWVMGEHETTVFVSNLPWHVTDDGLGRVFQQFAEVVRARVIQDRETGRSQAYGFVQLTSREAASAVCAALDGSSLDGRRLEVKSARPVTRGPA